jgi:type VII secretion protein EccE
LAEIMTWLTAPHAARIAVWQLVILTVILSGLRPVQTASALAVLVVAAVRVRGRWLDQWLLIGLGFRRRSRSSAASPLATVAVRSFANQAGDRVGIATDGRAGEQALVAVLRVELPPRAGRDEVAARLRVVLDRLYEAFEDADVRLTAAQLVTWAVPTPALNGEGVEAHRVHWVAVRFEPRDHPAAVEARGGGEDGALRATAAVALRLAASLRQYGFPVRVLDAPELREDLTTSIGADPGKPAERWGCWTSGALHHAGYRLRRAARDRDALAATLAWIARPPALTTCVSVLLRRSGNGRPAAHVVVRVAVPVQAPARPALREATKALAAYAVALNGTHARGVRATLPLCSAI